MKKNAVSAEDLGRVPAFDSRATAVETEKAPARRLGHGFEKFAGFYSQCVCQRNDVYDRDIPLAPLDSPNVVAMQIR